MPKATSKHPLFLDRLSCLLSSEGCKDDAAACDGIEAPEKHGRIIPIGI